MEVVQTIMDVADNFNEGEVELNFYGSEFPGTPTTVDMCKDKRVHKKCIRKGDVVCYVKDENITMMPNVKQKTSPTGQSFGTDSKTSSETDNVLSGESLYKTFIFEESLNDSDTQKCIAFWKSVMEKNLTPIKCTIIENKKKREKELRAEPEKKSSVVENQEDKIKEATDKVHAEYKAMWLAALKEIQDKKLDQVRLIGRARCKLCETIENPMEEYSTDIDANISTINEIKDLNKWESVSSKPKRAGQTKGRSHPAKEHKKPKEVDNQQQYKFVNVIEEKKKSGAYKYWRSNKVKPPCSCGKTSCECNINPAIISVRIPISTMTQKTSASGTIDTKVSKKDTGPPAYKTTTPVMHKTIRPAVDEKRSYKGMGPKPDIDEKRSYKGMGTQTTVDEKRNYKEMVSQPFVDEKSSYKEMCPQPFVDEKRSYKGMSSQPFVDEKKSYQEMSQQYSDDEKRGYQGMGQQTFGDEKKGLKEIGQQTFGDEKRGYKGMGQQIFGDEKKGYKDMTQQSYGDEKRGYKDMSQQSYGDEKRGYKEMGQQTYGDEKRIYREGQQNYVDEKGGNKGMGQNFYGDDKLRDKDVITQSSLDENKQYVDDKMTTERLQTFFNENNFDINESDLEFIPEIIKLMSENFSADVSAMLVTRATPFIKAITQDVMRQMSAMSTMSGASNLPYAEESTFLKTASVDLAEEVSRLVLTKAMPYIRNISETLLAEISGIIVSKALPFIQEYGQSVPNDEHTFDDYATSSEPIKEYATRSEPIKEYATSSEPIEEPDYTQKYEVRPMLPPSLAKGEHAEVSSRTLSLSSLNTGRNVSVMLPTGEVELTHERSEHTDMDLTWEKPVIAPLKFPVTSRKGSLEIIRARKQQKSDKEKLRSKDKTRSKEKIVAKEKVSQAKENEEVSHDFRKSDQEEIPMDINMAVLHATGSAISTGTQETIALDIFDQFVSKDSVAYQKSQLEKAKEWKKQLSASELVKGPIQIKKKRSQRDNIGETQVYKKGPIIPKDSVFVRKHNLEKTNPHMLHSTEPKDSMYVQKQHVVKHKTELAEKTSNYLDPATTQFQVIPLLPGLDPVKFNTAIVKNSVTARKKSFEKINQTKTQMSKNKKDAIGSHSNQSDILSETDSEDQLSSIVNQLIREQTRKEKLILKKKYCDPCFCANCDCFETLNIIQRHTKGRKLTYCCPLNPSKKNRKHKSVKSYAKTDMGSTSVLPSFDSSMQSVNTIFKSTNSKTSI